MKTICLMTALTPFANDMTRVSETGDASILQDPMFPIYLAGGAVILLLLLVSVVAIYVVRVLKLLTSESQGITGTPSVVHTPTVSPWKKFLQKINASVPVEQEKEIEMDHSYDGIRELDNHLPPWWSWLFYGSIAWGVRSGKICSRK